MRLRLTGRHVKVTTALRQYVEDRLSRLARYGEELGDVQVIIGVEKYRHVAEAKLTLNGSAIQAKASTKEMYTSIDELLDKIVRQAAKKHDKLVSHKARPAAARTTSRSPKRARAFPQVTTVAVSVPILTSEEAVDRLAQTPSSEFMYFNPAVDRIQIMRRSETGDVEITDPRPASSRGR